MILSVPLMLLWLDTPIGYINFAKVIEFYLRKVLDKDAMIQLLSVIRYLDVFAQVFDGRESYKDTSYY